MLINQDAAVAPGLPAWLAADTCAKELPNHGPGATVEAMVLLLQVHRELPKVRVFCSRHACFVFGCGHQGRVHCLLLACRRPQLDQADKGGAPQVGPQSGEVDSHCGGWGC